MSEILHLPLCYLTNELREHEAKAQENHPSPPLMERAGKAAADWLLTRISNTDKILIIAGPGNNGGDALVMSRLLQLQGVHCTTVLLGKINKLPIDAANAYQAYCDAGFLLQNELPTIEEWTWGIDGIFGIGLTRHPEGAFAKAIEYLNQCSVNILALDMPSGLNADTGVAFSPCVIAHHTLTYLGWKPGLFTYDGRDYAGEAYLDELGVPAGTASGTLIHTAPVQPPPRKHNSHKGTYGTVGILGGEEGMEGAVILATRAALKSGAGKVIGSCLGSLQIDMNFPQIMRSKPEKLLSQPLSVLGIGPGLGTSAEAQELLKTSLSLPIPLVIDADALNLIAANPALKTLCQQRNADTIITPHPLEAARLLHTNTESININRIESALKLAKEYNSTVVLKGSGSIIATPDGQWFVNTSGHPGMAVAGMGDVLTGMIAGVVAQGVTAKDATSLTVWAHGETSIL
ncbi:NAD(P)H-hydrate dehydratase [Leeia sp. TBRC 13508]|uniref:Bifunctional NAD(P)H-hydrate repair enzyme n=1 Tax=Leeia speluncae TaxID=2884804 RepID=A0ABS8D5A2_9NEIS|nr:NAD(P)H-hydrate dehydratase [Leeia speluncae]MCB6183375.1 NAD(P)H-hydrate dehydratase [Leeia speluncae]